MHTTNTVNYIKEQTIPNLDKQDHTGPYKTQSSHTGAYKTGLYMSIQVHIDKKKHQTKLREGFKKTPTNLGFWLHLRWVGVRRGSWCPTPLNRFSFIALN